MRKIKLNYFPNDSNWVGGTIEDLEFEAKVFDEPSKYGIYGGKVSKLIIDGIANYDRGWEFGEDEPFVKDVVDFLEDSTKRFGGGF